MTLPKGRGQAIKYGDVWLFMGRGVAEPSGGHIIDDIGWRMPDLLAKAAELKAKGLTFTTEPRPGPKATHAPVLRSFTADPCGVRVTAAPRGCVLTAVALRAE